MSTIHQFRAPTILPRETVVTLPAVSVVVPTYREALNIAPLLSSIALVREQAKLDLDVWIMDDQSRDGTRQTVDALGHGWVHLVERTGPRGLSPAVIDGIFASRGRRLVVMDADLSHPASAIPEMLAALDRGAELAIGSRFTAGASIDADWSLFRWLNSHVAKALARPIAPITDPMSGFLAFDRDLLQRAGKLSPVGYKIGLELIVKCQVRKIAEVSIHFADRQAGKSKLNMKQQLLYLEHLRRLYAFKFLSRG